MRGAGFGPRPAQRFGDRYALVGKFKIVAVKNIALDAEGVLARADDNGVAVGELRQAKAAVEQKVIKVHMRARFLAAFDGDIHIAAAFAVHAARFAEI